MTTPTAWLLLDPGPPPQTPLHTHTHVHMLLILFLCIEMCLFWCMFLCHHCPISHCFGCGFPYPRALLHADVILLFGARLNWILHFGLPPRFNPHVKIIQVGDSWSCKGHVFWQIMIMLCLFYLKVELCAEEMGNNVRPAAALLGDVNAIVTQVCMIIMWSSQVHLSQCNPWVPFLHCGPQPTAHVIDSNPSQLTARRVTKSFVNWMFVWPQHYVELRWACV